MFTDLFNKRCVAQLTMETVILSEYCKVSKAVLLHHEGTKSEGKYSSYSFLTSAPDRSEWPASRSGCALPPGKDPGYPSDRRPGLRAGLDTGAYY
jgi:hypothetical protein